jgi:hypothetical protein
VANPRWKRKQLPEEESLNVLAGGDENEWCFLEKFDNLENIRTKNVEVYKIGHFLSHLFIERRRYGTFIMLFKFKSQSATLNNPTNQP